MTIECQLILLDNMDIDSIRAALAIANSSQAVEVEIIGSVTLKNAREIANAGADFIGVGSLMHSVITLDLGLDNQSNNLSNNVPNIE